MHHIDLHEARLRLGDLIDIALSGEEVVITQDDQPVLKLVCVVAPKARRKAGSAKGLIPWRATLMPRLRISGPICNEAAAGYPYVSVVH
jgi:antitoxin (DNA-binding transcriptional repressor) of toxin-antitoxin stability system